MDYKQLIELDGYINLWEVLPEDKHSKIAKQIWKALDEEGSYEVMQEFIHDRREQF